jgi:hypothetical protein
LVGFRPGFKVSIRLVEYIKSARLPDTYLFIHPYLIHSIQIPQSSSIFLKSNMSPPVWLITGSSSGFGLSLTRIALRAGHKVIATSRNPSKTPDLVSEVQKLGGVWHALDITSPESEIAKAVEKATGVWGRIDVLVNSAGYALLGAFETIRYDFHLILLSRRED